MKISELIFTRLSKIMDGKDFDEFFRPKYYREVDECLNILDMNYSVTAVGILGRALENETKEYFEKYLVDKRQFQQNSANFSIKQIRKAFLESNHANRLDLLNQRVVMLSKRGTTHTYKLKKKMVIDEDYNELVAISRARNDAFHGCDDSRYTEIDAKALTYIERGIVILAKLEKLNQ